MEYHILEWVNLLIRWVHVIVGIAWIGASFYFVWLENNLNKQVKNAELTGDLWAIHGGGIYHLQKYKLAPRTLPEQLHWFKWEAYSTWITGMLLLVTVFYLNAQTYLVSPDISLSPVQVVGIGIGCLILGWIIYDLLCKSPLRHQPILLGIMLTLCLVAAAYGLSLIMTGRGAYIHIGAIIGTMMVGNVFFVIIPAQKDLVAAVAAGQQPDPSKPKNALLRSRHNNYLTLPVIFIMISNHFPSTFGDQYNWLILLILAAVSVGVRHYFNTRQKSQAYIWALPLGVLVLFVMAYVTGPKTTLNQTTDIISDKQALTIIENHCQSCHAQYPTSDIFSSPPKGLILENIQQIKQHANKIYIQTVIAKAMPIGVHEMTELERQQLGDWLLALDKHSH